jgi:HD-GYP domain-containing protein (c-di-GMP phosphodiesterase class II)
MPTSPETQNLRLAELLASLSLAIDLGTGQPFEWVLRCTLLGVSLAKALGLNEDECAEVYYLALLRHVGCTAYAHQDAAMFGEELAIADGMTLDMDDMQAMMAWLFRSVGKGLPTLTRVSMIARMMAAGPHAADENHQGHCEVGERVAQTLGLSARIQEGLSQVYERWDGKGPKKIKGEDILRPVRIVQLAQDAATFYQVSDAETATAMVRARAGRYFDPTLADFFGQHAADVLKPLQTPSMWDAVLAAEPGVAQWLTEAQFDMGARVVADFTDMKSPYTLGHSSHVAELAAQTARQCNLPESEVVALRRAGLLHDIGRVGVSAGI